MVDHPGNAGLKAIVAMDGVKDLPLRVKAPFARALIAEAAGNHAEAVAQLELAVQKEQEA